MISQLETPLKKIELELARLVYGQANIASIGSIACGTILAISLRTELEKVPFFIPALVAILAANILRLRWTALFRAQQDGLENPTLWLRRLFSLEMVTGIAWGATAFGIPDVSMFHQFIFVLTLGGLVCGATVTFAPHIPSAIAFNITSLLMLALAYSFSTSNDVNAMGIAALSVIYGALMCWLTIHFHRNILRSVTLELENNTLIQQLRDNTAKLVSEAEEKQKRSDELQLARDKFRSLYNEYDSMLDHLPVGIVRLDHELRVRYINQAMKSILGVAPNAQSDAMGRIVTTMPNLQTEMHREGFEKLKNKKHFTVAYKHTALTGKEIQIEVRGVPLIENDTFVGALLLIIDMTQQEENNRKLRLAMDEAELANKSKSTFLANMSHELRTPLHGIIGLTDLIATAQTDKERQPLIKLVQHSANNLLSTVNQLLDLSRIESGRYQTNTVEVDIRAIVENEVMLTKTRAQEKGLTVESIIHQDVPSRIVADEYLIHHILQNLLGNALKFTERGHIKTRVEIEHQKDQHCRLIIQVEDTGIGIPVDKQSDIFAPFVQLDIGPKKRYPGSGLGMSIAKQFAHLLGGDITVKSAPGKGSTFEFSFDALLVNKNDSAENGETHIDVNIKNLEILVVDDNDVNRMIAVKMLQKFGGRADEASNGSDAIDKLSHRKYDIVLMDIDMPDMDGIETTKRIRDLQGSPKNIPIVAMTAHTMMGDRERFLAAGMDGYIGKPFNYQQLLQTVGKYAAH